MGNILSASTGSAESFLDIIKTFMLGQIDLGGIKITMWWIIAAVAGLIILLTILCAVLAKKRVSKNELKNADEIVKDIQNKYGMSTKPTKPISPAFAITDEVPNPEGCSTPIENAIDTLLNNHTATTNAVDTNAVDTIDLEDSQASAEDFKETNEENPTEEEAENQAPTQDIQPENVETEQFKVCPKCGAKVEGQFCPYCGTDVDAPVEDEPIEEIKEEVVEPTATVEEPVAEVESTPSKVCPKCGAKVEGQLCPYCGADVDAPVENEPIEEIKEEVVAPTLTVEEPVAEVEPTEQIEEKVEETASAVVEETPTQPQEDTTQPIAEVEPTEQVEEKVEEYVKETIEEPTTEQDSNVAPIIAAAVVGAAVATAIDDAQDTTKQSANTEETPVQKEPSGPIASIQAEIAPSVPVIKPSTKNKVVQKKANLVKAPTSRPAGARPPKKASQAKAEAKTTQTKAIPTNTISNFAPITVVNNDTSITVIKLFGDKPEPKHGKYVIEQIEGELVRPYRFVIKDKNNVTIFQSEGYKIRPRARQIETFHKAVNNGSIIYGNDKNGYYTFKLMTAENKIFGSGMPSRTLEGVKKDGDALKSYCENINFIEDPTV